MTGTRHPRRAPAHRPKRSGGRARVRAASRPSPQPAPRGATAWCRARFPWLLTFADHVDDELCQLLLLPLVGHFPELLEDALLRVLRVDIVGQKLADGLGLRGDVPVAHAHGPADVNGLRQGLPPLGPILHLQIQPVSTPLRLKDVRALNVPGRQASYV